MSNILIHMRIKPHSEYDIFSKTDYEKMSDVFRQQNISCPNIGNRLWFQGLVSEISGSENTLSYFHDDMSKDYINENFDMIVAPMANVFNPGFSGLLLRLAERFKGIKIPIYVIACGVQADSYDSLNNLCDAIKQPAQEFMKSVYNTGGEFALRGYFSKEFFDRMGFKSAVVTGCPSLYQIGRNLKVSDKKVSRERLCPLFNGNLSEYFSMAHDYPNAEFFDQDGYFHILHDPNCSSNIRELVHQYGFEVTQWLLSDKIKMIPNMNDWWNYLKNRGFHFSYGSRIHGSIMPILAGIPAAIEPQDVRTREMAEFFKIPIISRKGKSLYDIYTETNYSVFNKYFEQKYDVYEQFLVSHGIVNKVNTSNQFFKEDLVDVISGNRDELIKISDDFEKKQLLWKGYDVALRIKRRSVRNRGKK